MHVECFGWSETAELEEVKQIVALRRKYLPSYYVCAGGKCCRRGERIAKVRRLGERVAVGPRLR